jgi:hypothetical protein
VKSVEKKDITIGILSVVIVVLALLLFSDFLTFSKSKFGHTKIEGSLELRAYPKISETVPTVMVYVLVPLYDQNEVYLTEDGVPLSSVGNFTENDFVEIEGVSYNRDAVDGSGTYLMIEVFNIFQGD